ncbi:hypothetical protein COB21_02225 [Candidatus Aerophobetes bacterium]|uniref:Uncharacterized protein n=1 Tax=Aerophobetes bacterium TaxID=2030807 RepID=A0A2A4X5L7_UNCAE|nr:MAG: hypothetical protein COB21_02225 [Candidatus Aerophobetes bacterium]
MATAGVHPSPDHMRHYSPTAAAAAYQHSPLQDTTNQVQDTTDLTVKRLFVFKTPKTAPTPLSLKLIEKIGSGSNKDVFLATTNTGKKVAVAFSKKMGSFAKPSIWENHDRSRDTQFFIPERKLVQVEGQEPKMAWISEPLSAKGTAFENDPDSFTTQYETRIPTNHPHPEGSKNAIRLLALGPITALNALYTTAYTKKMFAFVHGDMKELQFTNKAKHKQGIDSAYITRLLGDVPEEFAPVERTIGYCDPSLMPLKNRYCIDDLIGIKTTIAKTLYMALTKNPFQEGPEYTFAPTLEKEEELENLLVAYCSNDVNSSAFRQQCKNHGFLVSDEAYSSTAEKLIYAKIHHVEQSMKYLTALNTDIRTNFSNACPDRKRLVLCLINCLGLIEQDIILLHNEMCTIGILENLGPLPTKEQSIVDKHYSSLSAKDQTFSPQIQLAIINERSITPANLKTFQRKSQEVVLSCLRKSEQYIRRHFLKNTGATGSPLKRSLSPSAAKKPKVKATREGQ